MRSDRKLGRFFLAVIVLSMHVIVLRTIFGERKALRVMPEEQALTWLTLPPLTRAPPAAAVGSNRSTPASNVTIRPLPEPQVPAPIQTQDPSEAILRGLLSCDLPDKTRYGLEERQRCEKLLGEMYTGPMPEHVLTETEQKLAQKFAHDKVVEDSPLMAPCFSTAGIGFSNRNCDGGGQPNGEIDRMQARAPRPLRAMGLAP